MLKELIDIYLVFFKMGAVTFGGGYAMLPILKREIVEARKWLDETKIMDFYAVSQGLPGIIAINVSVFIGYTRRKSIGAITAALGMVSPCLIIITIIAKFLSNFQDNVYVESALSAISICVAALVIQATIQLWKKGVKDLFGVILCLVVFTLMSFTNVSPILMVITSALLGVLVKLQKEKEIKQ